MKRLLYILSCILLLFPGITKTGVIIWFKANQQLISETLCINKDNKELDCRGCCVLNTKLKQVDEAEQAGEKSIPQQKTEKEWPLFVVVSGEPETIIYSSPLLFHPFILVDTSSYLKEIFHPPSVV